MSKEANPVATPAYENARKTVEALDREDQLRLVAEILALLGAPENQPPRSLLDLEGLGGEVWRGLDVDEYLRRERASWDG